MLIRSFGSPPLSDPADVDPTKMKFGFDPSKVDCPVNVTPVNSYRPTEWSVVLVRLVVLSVAPPLFTAMLLPLPPEEIGFWLP